MLNNQWIIMIIAGAVIFGIGFSILWHSKSGFKRPKIKGQKREYYTKGEAIIAKLKGKL